MYSPEQIKKNLQTNQRWLERAIVVLYDYQTSDEQHAEETKHRNDVGFNSADARKLSYYAQWLKSGKHLSGNHLQKAFKVVPKYHKQILNLINEKLTTTTNQN